MMLPLVPNNHILYFLLIITYKRQSNFVQIFAKSNLIQLEIDFIAHEKH